MPVDYPFRTSSSFVFSLVPLLPDSTIRNPPVSTYLTILQHADVGRRTLTTAPIHPAYLPACHPENIPDKLRLELGTPRRVYKPSESSRIQ